MSEKYFSKTSILTLTFDHMTWTSIGVMYLLEASTVSNLAAFKQRGQKIMSRHHLGYKLTNRQFSRKRHGPSLYKLNFSLQRMLWANFVCNWPIGSGEDENLESYRQTDRQTGGWCTIGNKNSSFERLTFFLILTF